MLPYYEKHDAKIRLIRLHPDFRFPGHLHVQCELIWIQNGEMTLVCDNQNWRIGPGGLFMIFPNKVHSYLSVTQDIQGYLLMFHPEEVYELQVHLLRSHPDKPCLNRKEIQPEVYYMLEWIAREWEKGSGQSLYRILISAVMNVTLPLMELRLRQDSREEDLIRQTMQILNEHFSEELSLQSVARQLGVTQWHLSHLFSAYLKMGFCSYINALRAQRARALLIATREPVTQIAYECGFGSQTTFNRVFRELFGMSPRQLRSLEAVQAEPVGRKVVGN